jgi:hypothetical protein
MNVILLLLCNLVRLLRISDLTIFSQAALCCSIIAEAATCPDVHVPITCKIRVFDDAVRTVDFARRLQRSGWESRHK